MKVIKDRMLNLDSSVITIGAFDGIHRGHQKLIETAQKRADSLNVPSVIYTFDPIPRVYFQNTSPIMSIEEKLEYFKNNNIDYVILAQFNENYAQKSVQDFKDELKMMNPKEIWVGQNFKFGKKKSGSTNHLRNKFIVNELPPVRCKEGEIISSTRIREFIKIKNINKAITLLGHSI